MSAEESTQVAVRDPSSALAISTEQFVELYMQPLCDDSWICRENIVKKEDLYENEMKGDVRNALLQQYAAERPPDPILEGMLWQERFMEEYRHHDANQDAKKAGSYRQKLMETYRRNHSDRVTAAAPNNRKVLTSPMNHAGGADTQKLTSADHPALQSAPPMATALDSSEVPVTQEQHEEL